MGTISLRIAGFFLAIVSMLAVVPARQQAHAAELVMFEREGCVYCSRWNNDIAPAYMASKEAKLAPLRRHDLAKGQPVGIKLAAPVRFTPTFVLVDNGAERGRITGYFDNAIFWGMLEKLVQPLKH
jgi:thioredoxin-related protein